MTDYWKWNEPAGVEKGVDYRKAQLISAGVDIGTISTKAAIMCDGRLCSYAVLRTLPGDEAMAQKALDRALEAAGMKMKNIAHIVSTGYGRNNVSFAEKAMTEIACHGKGAQYIFGPEVRTVLDIGGQDVKGIKIDGDGKVIDFNMNDKCASAPGRCIETFAEIVAIPVEDIGAISLEVEEEPEPVSSTCVTYANSAAANMMSRGAPKSKVMAAYCYSIAWRAHIQLRRLGVERELGFTGGVAKNKGITSRIEKSLGYEGLPPRVDPQLAGAIGAAIYAADLAGKKEDR